METPLPSNHPRCNQLIPYRAMLQAMVAEHERWMVVAAAAAEGVAAGVEPHGSKPTREALDGLLRARSCQVRNPGTRLNAPGWGHPTQTPCGWTAMQKLRIETWGFQVGDRSRGRYATSADFPLHHDGTPYRGLHVRRWGLGLSIVQGPISVAPCQTVELRFATFSSLYGGQLPCPRTLSHSRGERRASA
jgi:hypothetical protein